MMEYEVEDFNALRRVLLRVCSFLASERFSESAVFESKLILSELASNVLQHGGGKAHLRVQPVPGGIRLCVQGDVAFRPPEKSVCSSAEEESGRGLFLVDALSASREYSEEEGICVLLRVERT